MRPKQVEDCTRRRSTSAKMIIVLAFVWGKLATSGLASPIIVEPITRLEPIIGTETAATANGFEEKLQNNSFNMGDNNNINTDTNNNGTRAAASHEPEPLQLVKLFDPEVTCNDGSSIGYYMRLNNHSKSWVIYLEGGGFCGNEDSCQRRWQRTPEYMSSDYWPTTRTENGILSVEPTANPYLWNANHIYIAYCTSDSYTGLRQAHEPQVDSITTTTTAPDQRDLAGNRSNENNKNNRQRHNTNQQFKKNAKQQNGQFRSSNQGSQATSINSFAFMGSKVVERVLDSLFDSLAPEMSLYEAKSILIAGESAGAAGVILNLDKIKQFIKNKVTIRHELQMMIAREFASGIGASILRSRSMPIVRGLADSGWFVDNELHEFDTGSNHDLRRHASSGDSDSQETQFNTATQYNDYITPEWDCEQQLCSPKQTIRQAMSFWRGQVPSACSERHPNEPWLCYFGYRTYQTLETPLFVVQWLYDDYQLMTDKLIPISSLHQESADAYWQNVRKVGQQVRQSLENVTALFAPSCLSHSMITRQSWNQIYVNGFRLPHVLNRWEEQSLVEHAVDSSTLMTQSTEANARFGLQSGTNSKPTKPSSTRNVANEHAGWTRQATGPQTTEHGSNASASRSKGSPKKKRRNGGQNRSRLTARVSSYEQSENQQSNQHHQPQARSLSTSDQSATSPHSNINFINQDAKPSSTVASSDEPVLLIGNVMAEEFPGPTTAIASSQSTSSQQPALVASNGWYLVNNEQNALRLMLMNSSTRPKSMIDRANRFRLIDSCSWPQCNRDCPLLNPYLHSKLGASSWA